MDPLEPRSPLPELPNFAPLRENVSDPRERKILLADLGVDSIVQKLHMWPSTEYSYGVNLGDRDYVNSFRQFCEIEFSHSLDIQTAVLRSRTIREIADNPALGRALNDLSRSCQILEMYAARKHLTHLNGLENVLSSALHSLDAFKPASPLLGDVRRYLSFLGETEEISSLFRMSRAKIQGTLSIGVEGGKPVSMSFDQGQSPSAGTMHLTSDSVGSAVNYALMCINLDVVSNAKTRIEQLSSLWRPAKFYASVAEYFSGLRSRGFDLCTPEFLPTGDGRIEITDMRYPFEKEFDPVLPNDALWGSDERIRVITGLVNGGKTSYGRALLLNLHFARQGLLCFGSRAKVPFCDEQALLTAYPAGDNPEQGKGSFVTSLDRAYRVIADNAGPGCVVHFDDLLGGTDDQGDVAGLFPMLVDGIRRTGCRAIITTHHHAAAEELENQRYPGISFWNMRAEGQSGSFNPTYTLCAGRARGSYGLQTANAKGMTAPNLMASIDARLAKLG